MIRAAKSDDILRLAVLTTQLGYPSTPQQITRRLSAIERHADHGVFVFDDGAVQGWIHVQLRHTLEMDRHAEIAGLVVADGRRSQGVGKILVEAAEHWARERGASVVRVRTNVVRARAHDFYLKLGYRNVKDQKVFDKAL